MQFQNIDQWLSWLEAQHHCEIDLGLDRIVEVFQCLNINLDSRVITVAGTNGKGSFVALMAKLLEADGRRVACYTSPHLLDFNERIVIDGKPLDDEELLKSFQCVYDAKKDISLTYFEFTTLVALQVFANHQLDDVILEVGLGGRLDAVNIVTPDWAVITSIGIDHIEYLGSDIENIAKEKCGILRQKTPLICAESAQLNTLMMEKQARSSHFIGSEFDFSINDDGSWDYCQQLADQTLKYQGLEDNGLSMPSQAAAFYLANLLRKENFTQDEVGDIQKNCLLPGRFARYQDDGVTVIMDVAHNEQAVRLLSERLSRRHMSDGAKRLAVFSCLQDKPATDMVAVLKDDIDAWFIGELKHPRAYNVAELSAQLNVQGITMVSQSKNMRQAYARARSLCAEGDEILVCGSFFSIAEILPKLMRKSV